MIELTATIRFDRKVASDPAYTAQVFEDALREVLVEGKPTHGGNPWGMGSATVKEVSVKQPGATNGLLLEDIAAAVLRTMPEGEDRVRVLRAVDALRVRLNVPIPGTEGQP